MIRALRLQTGATGSCSSVEAGEASTGSAVCFFFFERDMLFVIVSKLHVPQIFLLGDVEKLPNKKPSHGLYPM